jgi:hypothetical protein
MNVPSSLGSFHHTEMPRFALAVRRMLASRYQSRLEENDEPRSEPVAGHQEILVTLLEYDQVKGGEDEGYYL